MYFLKMSSQNFSENRLALSIIPYQLSSILRSQPYSDHGRLR